MKPIKILLVMASCLFLHACVVPNMGGYAERRRGPLPEKEWNSVGIWKRVDSNPATYVPKHYSADLPRNEKRGVWVVDQRKDAEKKMFVPYGGSDGLSFAVLRAEANKVCNWRSQKVEWEMNTGGGMLLTP